MFPTIAKEEYENFLQENLCKPLRMTGTTFYPFGEGWDQRLRPLRYAKDAGGRVDSTTGEKVLEPGQWTWEELNGQLDLLTLPRK